MRNVFCIFLIILFVFGCSTHLERYGLSNNDFYSQINNELYNKSVIINYTNNKSDNGIFLKINEKYLLLQKSEIAVRISVSDILSINYIGGPSLIGIGMGALFGFGISLFLITITGARFDIAGGHGNKSPFIFLSIPVLTIYGAIKGGSELRQFNTIVLQK